MRFNYTHMRQNFYSWHSGQWSPLYAAASSGLVADVDALQAELRACATDCDRRHTAPFTGPREDQQNRREAAYLRRVADALPNILSAPRVHPFDGKTYRGLPWANWE